MKIFEAEHYIFNYGENSCAEKDIEKIADMQEKCLECICNTLKTTPSFKIRYYLCDSPEEVGRAYGDNEPCNGFADIPDKIYAVYNENVKCIGFHEDAHVVSYTINRPNSAAIREGLAMYFDRMWWGIPNIVWTKSYIDNGLYLPFDKLLDEDCFFENDCALTYPVAGAFTEWLIFAYGIEKYLSLYKQNDMPKAFENIYGKSAQELTRAFEKYVQLFAFDDVLTKRTMDLLKEYGIRSKVSDNAD